MFNFKKFMIKQFLQFRVIEQKSGKLLLKISDQVTISSKFREYDQYVLKGMKLYQGIKDVQFHYESGTIEIIYDTNQLTGEKVLIWTNKVIDVVLNHYSLIKKYGKTNLDYVLQKIQQQLTQESKRL